MYSLGRVPAPAAMALCCPLLDMPSSEAGPRCQHLYSA